MNQESQPKSKLIIDEDWKTQVAREKEQFRQTDSDSSSHQSAGTEPTAKSENVPDLDAKKLPPPPPANFALLVTTLGTQALAAMGQLPDGEGVAPPARMDYAKHYIDMLDMLEGKTKNNITSQESQLIAEWLHQLRMTFVVLSSRK